MEQLGLDGGGLDARSYSRQWGATKDCRVGV